MLIELHQTDDVCILRFEGRFTTGVELEYLRGRAEELKQQACGKVLVDFRDVVSVGSTAIGFIVAIYSSVIAKPEGRFVLVGAQPRVREVLDLTRLSSILPMAADIASGLALLRGSASAHNAR
ncbi:MAG TPA: STAS domain-containing protein [Bryobacteraceae bacterium]|jgi:anti-anti-sigma factor|nr:STAS domain-containing protein [Bryobacteraceae bacterium]